MKAIYARCSVDDKGERFTIAAQLRECRGFAEGLGWDVPDDLVFVDDGISGATLDRPGLSRLRDAIEDGRVDGVLAYDADRLSRNLGQMLFLQESCEKKGVDVRFVTGGSPGTTAEERMFFQIKGAFAEYQRAKIIELTRSGKRERARSGRVSASRTPYGYAYDRETGTLAIDPERAEVVRSVFRWFLEERLATRRICERLASLGVPGPSGRRWWRFTVSTMLKNTTYGGVMYHNRRPTPGPRRPKGEWIPVPVPAIIPMRRVEEATALLAEQKERTGHSSRYAFLLSGIGILKCSCGASMIGRARLRKNGTAYRWYDCNAGTRQVFPSETCKVPNVKADVAESAIWEKVSDLLTSPSLVLDQLRSRQTDSSEEVEGLRSERAVVAKALGGISDEYETVAAMGRERLFGERTLDIIRAEARKLEKKEATLRKRLDEIDRTLKGVEISDADAEHLESVCRRLTSNLAGLSLEERRRLLALLVHKIVWDGNALQLHMAIPAEVSTVEEPRWSASPPPVPPR